MSLRLAYLDPHPVPDMTPSSINILQNADAMANLGVDTHLVTLQSTKQPEAVLGRPLSEKVTRHFFHDFRRRWYFPFASHYPYYLQVWMWLKRNPVDAVYVRNLKLADWLLNQGILKKTPLFFEAHEVFAQTYREEHPQLKTAQEQGKYEALLRRERCVYSNASGIFTLTSHILNDAKQSYASDRPAWVVPNGVDFMVADQAYVEKPWQSHQPLKLLYLGSLHPWKGLETLLAAMQSVSAAHLTIAGGSSVRIQDLQHLAARLGVQDKVSFTGQVQPADRFRLIAEHDVCLLPLSKNSMASRYTSPLKLFEYMVMGKPIIVADLPSTREILSHNENALLCEADNPNVLAQAIISLQENPLLAEKLAYQARQLALKYSLQQRATTIRDAICELVV